MRSACLISILLTACSANASEHPVTHAVESEAKSLTEPQSESKTSSLDGEISPLEEEKPIKASLEALLETE